MSQQFRITIDTHRVENFLKKLPSKVQEKSLNAMKTFGNHLVKELLKQAKIVGISQFRGSRSMFTSTRYVQKGTHGYVFMPKSGLYQDRATPHWVPVRGKYAIKRPLLQAWVAQKKFSGPGFYFKPRPFIHQGFNNSLRRLPVIMRPAIRAAIKESH